MKSTTAERLAFLMKTRGLRQADILEMITPLCKQYNVSIPRNALSQYVTGKVIPKQDKLSILSMAFDVSEPWLMGYDVPMTPPQALPVPSSGTLTPDEQRLLDAYRAADDRARQDAVIMLETHPREDKKENRA